MTDQHHLERINALTRNARTTWFALLAALVFVGVTLMSVEHIDFYGVDRATQLPLVNVAVPTRYFFVASPILIAAIYGYFHLYLIRLWDALGTAPARLNGIRLGDAVTPWLVTDAALTFRSRRRKDNSTAVRILENPAALLNLLLAWGFGLIVLAFFWFLSLPARSFWLSGIGAASFIVSLLAAAGSLETMVKRLGKPNQTQKIRPFKRPRDYPLLALGVFFSAGATYLFTEGPTEYLARLDLSDETIIERPPGWLSRQDARAEFRAEWCRREFIEDCGDLGERESDFSDEFDRRRSAAIADMRRPDWDRPTPADTGMNFRLAALPNSFLVGASLSGAQMEGAVLSEAQMEGAVLRGAQIEGAVLRGAQMVRALLHFSQLTGAKENVTVLFNTNLSMSLNNGGMLRFVDPSNVVFDAATDFRNTILDGTVTMAPAFRAQMGRPCQWAEGVLDYAEFYGRWRGWIDANPSPGPFEDWSSVAPTAYRDVTPIPPPPGCTWKTGPMGPAQQDR